MAFFDRFLKDQPNEADAWPKVRLEVREGIDVGRERTAKKWLLARTEYTPLHLGASTASLSPAPVAAKPVTVFSHTFERDTELTGYFRPKLWVETDGAGDLVKFHDIMRFRFGHVAHERLRVSHRELDTERAQHTLPAGAPASARASGEAEQETPVEIEIWPSSTLLLTGEQVRVVVMGKDPFPPTDNPGVIIIMAPENPQRRQARDPHGGRFDGHMLLPVIPA